MLKRLNPEMVLTALFVTLLWVGIWGWHDKYAPTEKQKDECYETAKRTGQKSDECKSFWERTTSDPVAFSVGLWSATIRLYYAGERQIKIASKAANVTEAALLKLERAFVHPKDMFVRWHWYLDIEPKSYFWKIRPIYENAGSSSTVELITNINSALLDQPLPDDFPFPLAENRFTAFIGAKSTINGGVIEIKAADLIAIRNGSKHFYFWGLLRYNDIFDGSPEHVTTFCREIVDITGNPFNPSEEGNPVNLTFSMTDRYNSAD
jgi:hypothetical protein